MEVTESDAMQPECAFRVRSGLLAEEDRGGVGRMPLYSAVFSLANTIIGSGALTMPHVFASCGWLLANGISLAIILLTTFSVYLLVVASDRVGGTGAHSFESLGYLTCGVAGSVYAQATFIVGGLGTLTAYLVFIGKLVVQVAGIPKDNMYIPLVVILVTCIIPLTLPRTINSLRYASLVALFAILYVSVMFMYFWLRIGEYTDDPTGHYAYVDPVAVLITPHTISALNLLIGAFCVQNTCLPIYAELKNRSPGRIVFATLISMGISLVIYEILGLGGYYLLGGNVQSNSLLNFDEAFLRAHPWTRTMVSIAQVSMACLITLSVPLAIWPCRSAICSVVARARAGCSGPARGSDAASDRLFRAVTVGILGVVTILALWTPDVAVPLGLVNSIAGGSMIFVMPGLFYLGSIENKAERFSLRNWHAYAMIVIGICVATVGFILQVNDIRERYNH
eukprot:TRINITY_DN112403_c0_g1_i1.p1 TRINITY_DN112403_c0_g1~~TRINITY_DN112403_c0_g1_i1.p1  ORF type:complete len:492 (-),score=32.52 TRINITY_DN112403_c0_g1_i1:142-1497(-)